MKSLAFVILAACGSSPSVSPDASVAPDVAVSTCDSGEHMTLHGAFDLDVASAATTTFGGHVIGITGATTPQTVYALSLRHVTMGNFDAIGDYDIATQNVKYLADGHGFFALAGTLHVTQTTPRYRATFELTDLRAHDDTSDTLGAPIAGTVTGCVNANPI